MSRTLPGLGPTGVGLVAGIALCYEVLLVQVLGFCLQGDFVGLILAVAMLGLSLGGVVVGLGGPERVRVWVDRGALLLGPSIVLAMFGVEHVEVSPFLLAGDLGDVVRLAILSFLVHLPFLGSSLVISGSLMARADISHLLYATDLIGAAIGSLLGVAAGAFLPLESASTLLAATGGALAALGSRGTPRRGALGAALCLVAAAGIRLPPGQYKDLAGVLRLPGSRILEVRPSLFGPLHRVHAPELRHAPTLSLRFEGVPTSQDVIYINGTGPTPIATAGWWESMARIQSHQLDQLAHFVRPVRSLAIVGSGGGAEIARGLRQGIARVTAVEPNARLLDLWLEIEGVDDLVGDRVRLVRGSPRRWLAREEARFDLVVLPRSDSLGASRGGGGAGAPGTTPLDTVEALGALLDRLERPVGAAGEAGGAGGLLAIGRWLRTPPRDLARLVHTLLVTLEARGVEDPSAHLVLVRDWNVALCLISLTGFTGPELARVREFTDRLGFDRVWMPGMKREEANRFHVLPEPVHWEACRALAGPRRDAFVAAHPFDISPATDAQPHGFAVFRPRTIVRVLSGDRAMVLGSGEWDLLFNWVMLPVLTLMGAVLLLSPLLLRRDPDALKNAAPPYFTGLGLGYLMMEVGDIQVATLALGTPSVAMGSVITIYLVGSGLGSLASRRVLARLGPRTLLLSIVGLAILRISLLPRLMPHLNTLDPLPALLTMSASILPLSFLMGVPFPHGLRSIPPASIPWAWAINGVASVLAGPLSRLVALHLGLSALGFLAATGYGLSLATCPTPVALRPSGLASPPRG